MAAPRKVEFSIGAVDRTRRVINRIRRGFRRLGSAVTGFRGLIAGVFAGAAVRGLARFAEGLENIQDSAEGLGLTNEELQALVFAAKEVGVSARDIETVFQRLGRRAGQAADDNDLLLEKFEKLGISLDDLKNQNSLELFDTMLASLREMPRAIAEARIADILDTEGLRLLRRINPEFEDFNDILTRARAGGAILDDTTLKRMEDAARTLREFADKLEVVFAPKLAEFVSLITPHLPTLADKMGALADALVQFVAVVPDFLKRDTGVADPGAAARQAGAATRRAFAQGRGTAGGRLIQDGIDALVELVEINRRAERRAQQTPETGYGP